jgi:uncharacterized protein (DUF2141 family)
MNYLTNYYKNLSEKLQHRVNKLESQTRMINEALTSYTVYGNRPVMADRGFGSGIPGDYNGDGRVDGSDLGISLGNYGQPGYDYQGVVSNWTGNMSNAGPAFRSTAAPSAGRGRVNARGVESMGGGAVSDTVIPGDYNGDGRVDGADLGISLGNYGQPGSVISNWSGRVGNAGPAFRSTASNRGRVSSRGVESMGFGAVGDTVIPGDYNGDGRVDGADLGISLGNYGQPGYNQGNVIGNWSGRVGNAGPAFRSTAAPSAGRGRNAARGAEGMDTISPGAGIPGDYNGDGRVDGADLGIALGNYGQPGSVINNWSGSMSNAGPATYRSAPTTRQRVRRG